MYYLRFTIHDFTCKAGVLLTACALLAAIAGCNNKFFDPSQVGRFRPTPAVNVILDSLGVAEEPAVAWENAEEPRPEDIRAVKTDYVLQPGDVVTVSIYELLQEGVPVTNNYMITETGKLSIPDVGIVEAAGLTETQLEDEIRQILSPNILRNPSVMVTMVTSQQRAFAILGNGVPAPGRYVIPRYDYRLTDALAGPGPDAVQRWLHLRLTAPGRRRDRRGGNAGGRTRSGVAAQAARVIGVGTAAGDREARRFDRRDAEAGHSRAARTSQGVRDRTGDARFNRSSGEDDLAAARQGDEPDERGAAQE